METLIQSIRAAGEMSRLRLLNLLDHCDLTVTELTQILSQSQPRVSRHLKLLTDAGLATRYQEGAWVFYRRTRTGQAGDIVDALMRWLPADSEVRAADERRLARIRELRRSEAAVYFERIAARWDRVRNLRVDETQVEQRIVGLANLKPTSSVLDLGTGTGRMLELLAPQVEWGLGIDLSREMLSLARTRLDDAGVRNCQVRLGDIYNVDLADNAVDLVTVHQVLHYLDEPEAAIAEAARVLSPGGQLIVIDLAPHGIEFLRDDHAHRRLGFEAREILEICERAGLTDVAVEHLEPHREDPAALMESESLTVSIWSAHKPVAVTETRLTANQN